MAYWVVPNMQPVTATTAAATLDDFPGNARLLRFCPGSTLPTWFGTLLPQSW